MTQLKISNLTVRFGGLVAVDGVDIELREGEILGLIGPNGAGKTTLFNCISRFVPAVEGSIYLNGHDLLRRRPHDIMKLGIARTFQNVNLFPRLTVLDNILVGMHTQFGNTWSTMLSLPWGRLSADKMREKARHIARILDLEGVLDQKATDLPFGYQKAVELGRCLIADPKIILLDEPATGRNIEETKELSELITGIRKEFGATIMLVEHNMAMVMPICERIYVMNFGRIIAMGTAAEIQANPAVIEAYLGGEVTNAAN